MTVVVAVTVTVAGCVIVTGSVIAGITGKVVTVTVGVKKLHLAVSHVFSPYIPI